MTVKDPTLLPFAATIHAVDSILRRSRRIALAAIWLVILPGLVRSLPAVAADADHGTPSPPSLIRIGVGPGIWRGVNRNDASAAIKVWAKLILHQRESSSDVDTQVFETPAALSDALKHGRIDAATMLADNFLGMPPEQQPDTVFIATKDRAFTENYLLLVRRNAGISALAGLAGRKLVFQDNARTSLALQWFDTLLARQSLGSAETVLGSLTASDSPSKAVLKVFFHQADACLVTSNVFALSCELNPQLRKELQVMAVSPDVVPALFFFRPDYKSSLREQMESAIVTLRKTPASLEVLTVFQSDGMLKLPLTSLDSTRQLLAEYERTKQRVAAGSPTNSPPPISHQ